MERLIIKNAGLMVKVGFLGLILAFAGCTDAFAGDVLSIARSQIGQGEQGGDNKGPVVRKYTQGQQVAWCAGFVSWSLKQAGKTTPYMLSAKAYLKVGQKVTSPLPGDLIVLSRKGGGGHVGIVEEVAGDRLVTIEGNLGKYPSKVKRVTYRLSKIKNLLGFVRV